MPVEIARHQTIDKGPQHTTDNQSIFILCLVSYAVLTSLQVTDEDPQIRINTLCMVKKKH